MKRLPLGHRTKQHDLELETLRFVGAHPGATVSEVAGAVFQDPSVRKSASARAQTMLTKLLEEGKVRRDERHRPMRWFVEPDVIDFDERHLLEACLALLVRASLDDEDRERARDLLADAGRLGYEIPSPDATGVSYRSHEDREATGATP